jgi:serine/threonine protein kinase
MEMHTIHMDLKPANILIDNNMVPKLADFGLSIMAESSRAGSTNRLSSLGYTAPEYQSSRRISLKSDVYSLGIIIIELVTGHRSIPDSNNVMRRWRHRWQKSGEKTPFRYVQIAKLLEIGLLCQEIDPYKRPSMSDIIHVISEIDNTDKDDMLGIEPLELCFPFELNSQISRSLELTNETDAFIAFSIQKTSPLPYCIQPNKDIVAPRSVYSVNITLQPLDYSPQDRQHTGDFIVRSTKVNECLISEDITEDTFNIEEGKLVDEVNLKVTYKAEVPQKSNVPSTEAESKFCRDDPGQSIIPSTSSITSRPSSASRSTHTNNYLSAAEPMAMTFQELHHITDGFSEKRLLGKGGFGMVYKWIHATRVHAPAANIIKV